MKEVEPPLLILQETEIPEPWSMDLCGLPEGLGTHYSLTALMTM